MGWEFRKYKNQFKRKIFLSERRPDLLISE